MDGGIEPYEQAGASNEYFKAVRDRAATSIFVGLEVLSFFSSDRGNSSKSIQGRLWVEGRDVITGDGGGEGGGGE